MPYLTTPNYMFIYCIGSRKNSFGDSGGEFVPNDVIGKN